MELFILILEIVGTVSFALSGAMTGLKKNMDIFGVCVLGVTTAVGGGILRDLLLGLTPPATFLDPKYVLMSIVTSLFVFSPVVRRVLFHSRKLYDALMLISDSAGLGIFTVYGARVAIGAGYEENLFLVLFVAVITGVGGGVIVNGKVIDGAHGAGGEIGHITVNRHETATCGCGKHGCLEQYSSATGVVRCMKKLLDENPDTPCTLRGTEFAAKDVFDAARNGDALAAREVDEMTDTLGMALATIAATVDPEMFMVGGGVSRAGEVLFAPLREHFKVYAFKSCRETPIVPAILGNDAGIYGSVRLIVGE